MLSDWISNEKVMNYGEPEIYSRVGASPPLIGQNSLSLDLVR